MKHEIPKRIAIFGLPGSGKTTFADKLGKLLKIPVHHIDKHYFLPNWEFRYHNEFLAIQNNLVNEESWIIEGNSIKTLGIRFAKADVVIYFCYPRYLCLWRVCKRAFYYDKTINDTPDGCSKGPSWPLIKYLWTFKKEKRETLEEFQRNYPHVKFYTFYNDNDAFNYLNDCKG